jgi:predicted nucleic acid-binding Zn ribbon protein
MDSTKPKADDTIEAELGQLHLDDLVKRSRSIGPHAKTIKSVVKNWQTRRNISAEQVAILTEQQWRLAVGIDLAAHTQPGNIKRGNLEVFVDSPLVMQELTMQRDSLVRALKEVLPNISGIRFRAST